ncbi:regulatory protein, gntR family [Cohaesibacter sp. ES.047]|uniref:GntR family transcriptional regulator n=1 Tax=Cohaesibacter sp. ES.047 TaxID=1798205 RepID=UPI000BC05523|nr:GntR family transcriptional regulator [Cohaesibacter sp. ES.047]SNY91672.1 regulatory protein, gntR family [Cohaesibacter sp. ES.047]
MNSPSARTNRREEVADWIAAEIKRLGPGAKLPSMRAMMLKFSTSQRVIEAALSPFVAEGRLISRRGQGIVIASPAAPDADEAVE